MRDKIIEFLSRRPGERVSLSDIAKGIGKDLSFELAVIVCNLIPENIVEMRINVISPTTSYMFGEYNSILDVPDSLDCNGEKIIITPDFIHSVFISKLKCSVCGGCNGDDDFGPWESDHQIGCPMDPNNPPWL